MVADINLCGSNNFDIGISCHENSRLGKVHDPVSGYLVIFLFIDVK